MFGLEIGADDYLAKRFDPRERCESKGRGQRTLRTASGRGGRGNA